MSFETYLLAKLFYTHITKIGLRVSNTFTFEMFILNIYHIHTQNTKFLLYEIHQHINLQAMTEVLRRPSLLLDI